MGVRLYISGNSGNQKIENEQQQIQRVLQMRKIAFELVDIMLPGNQNERAFMRERGKKKDGQRNVIPPQIFNGQEFRGDFDDFDISNEDDVLEEFLGLERLKPKIEPFKTGAVAPEVNKLKVGKLDIKEEEKSKNELHISVPEEETSQVVEEQLLPLEICKPHSANDGILPHQAELRLEVEMERKYELATVESPDLKEADQQEEVDSAAEIDSCDSDSKPAEESDSGVELDEEEKAEEEEKEEKDNEEDKEKGEDTVEGESSNDGGDCDEGDDTADDNDDENKKIVEEEDLGVGDTGGDSETDTEDFTDSEDDEVEYMDDGEPVRKCKRGFKILQNCKRFWKASYD